MPDFVICDGDFGACSFRGSTVGAEEALY